MCLTARRHIELLSEFPASHLSHAVNIGLLMEFQAQN
jgi:hypothetical protein